MIVKSLYLLFLLTFLVLPFFYHRKKSKPSMTKFYLRMAFSHNFRKCYRLVLLSTLLMFHFYHLSLFKLSGKREEEYIEILSKKSGNMANNLSDTLWNLDMK